MPKVFCPEEEDSEIVFFSSNKNVIIKGLECYFSETCSNIVLIRKCINKVFLSFFLKDFIFKGIWKW